MLSMHWNHGKRRVRFNHVPATSAGRVEKEHHMYAVAGVSGQTGAAVARELLEAGEKVRVIVRREDAGAAWRGQGAEVAVADIVDAKALTGALRGTRGAYLLNPPSYQNPDPVARAGEAGKAIAEAIDAS